MLAHAFPQQDSEKSKPSEQGKEIFTVFITKEITIFFLLFFSGINITTSKPSTTVMHLIPEGENSRMNKLKSMEGQTIKSSYEIAVVVKQIVEVIVEVGCDKLNQKLKSKYIQNIFNKRFQL